MGPTNIALVKLYEADRKLREEHGRLDSVTRNVRIQKRKVTDLSEQLRLLHSNLKDQQSQAGQFELDLKARDEKIEKLRAQQTNAKTNREYQAFLVEINTEKVEKGKSEEQLLKVMEGVEKLQASNKELSESLDAENKKLETMQTEIDGKVKELQAKVDALKPSVETAANAVPPRARDAFERLAEKFEGEALSSLLKPDRRKEAYACSVCNMDLVTDVYNKLHTRDELVFCPSCHRILYIPDDLPIDVAVNKVKERKEPRVKTKDLKASINRQTAAENVLNSIAIEDDDGESTENSSASSTPSSSDTVNADDNPASPS